MICIILDFSNFMRHQVLILIFILGIIIQESVGFIIQVKQGDRRCFKAEQSPDKTLQVKVGFPRRQKQNCDVLFSVDNVKEGKFKSNIYSDMHRCHQMTPGHPTVIKHTSQAYDMDGHYQICFQVVHDKNNQLLLEIFIGQKLNPLLYSDGDDVLPLIQAEQLIDLDLKIQSIRKSLGWSRKMLNEGKQKGDKLQSDLNYLNQFSINATFIQIGFLAAYAIVWVVFIKNQRVK